MLLVGPFLCFRLLQSMGRGAAETEGGDGDMSTSSSRSSALQQHDGLPRLREAISAAAPEQAATADAEVSEERDDREELLQRLKQLSCTAATKERLLQVHTGKNSPLAAAEQQHQAALDAQNKQALQKQQQ